MAESEGKELSRIERELVLGYLRDGGAALSITPEGAAAPPVRVPAERVRVHPQGLILLDRSLPGVRALAGRPVRVRFYFNRLGLSFVGAASEYSQGLAVVVPPAIRRTADTSVLHDGAVRGDVTFADSGGKPVSLPCAAVPGYRLRGRPSWDDVPEDRRSEAKRLLERFVAESKRSGVPIGSGLHLMPVCRYLAGGDAGGLDAVEGAVKPFGIIYMDEKRLVLAKSADNMRLKLEESYGLSLEFALGASSLLRRTVKARCRVENKYGTPLGGPVCYVCRYTGVKEEDSRFLAERAGSADGPKAVA